MPSLSSDTYDVFISYSRKDLEWVKGNLHEPLLRCRRPGVGTSTHIFFDLSDEGVTVGKNYIDALVEAIRSSRLFLPVYSRAYFDSKQCQWELDIALLLLHQGKIQFVPILIEPAAESLVPMKVSMYNFYPTTSAGWFDRLLGAMDLVQLSEQAHLEFLDQPRDTMVNFTLPPVRVRLHWRAGPLKPQEEEVRLSAGAGTLQGTLALPTEGGVAEFRDLSFSEEAPTVRLTASARGCAAAVSEPFAVRAVPVAIEAPPPPPAPETVAVSAAGEPFFLGSGQALAVLGDAGLRLFDLEGQELRSGEPPLDLPGPVRFRRRRGDLVALAEWTGRLTLLHRDGQARVWTPPARQGGFLVPADLAFRDQSLLIGYWNGAVYEVSLEEEAAPVVLRHEHGVQALTWAEDRIFLGDFQGNLCVYRQGRLINAHPLEEVILSLRRHPDCLVAVGAAGLYQIALTQLRVFREQAPFARIHYVLDDGSIAVIMDEHGKGLFMDRDLAVRGRFTTTPGAVPLGLTADGGLCVLRQADGTHSLLVEGRIVFTHPAPLAASPDGKWMAVGEKDGFRLFPMDRFRSTFLGAGPDACSPETSPAEMLESPEPKEIRDEEEAVYGRAGHRDFAASGAG